MPRWLVTTTSSLADRGQCPATTSYWSSYSVLASGSWWKASKEVIADSGLSPIADVMGLMA